MSEKMEIPPAVENKTLQSGEAPVQLEIVGTLEEQLNPLTGVDGPVIAFKIENSIPEHYLDLSETFMQVELRLQKKDGTAFTYNENQVSVVNNLWHSLWSDIHVKLNHKAVTESLGNYAYMAYVLNLIQMTPQTLEEQGPVFGWWHKDVGGEFEDTTLKRLVKFTNDSANNKPKEIATMPVDENAVSFRNRAWFNHLDGTTNYHDIKLLAQPLVVPFVQTADRFLYIPYGVKVNLEFEKMQPAFFMMADKDKSCTVKILSAKLFVTYKKLNQAVYLKLEDQASKTTQVMPVTRNRIHESVIAQGTVAQTFSNIFNTGALPNKILIAMVTNNAARGVQEKNPFNFQNFGLVELQVIVNGRSYPPQALEMDFATMNHAEAFTRFQKTTGAYQSPLSSNISFDDYPRGFTLFGVNISGDTGENSYVQHLKEFGSLTIKLKFKTALTQAVSLFVISDNEEKICIDELKNVTTSWD